MSTIRLLANQRLRLSGAPRLFDRTKPRIYLSDVLEWDREEVESLETTYVATKEEVSDLLRQREQLVAQLSAVKARSQSLQRVQQRQQDSFSRVTMAKIDQRSTAVDNSLDELSSVASLVAGCYAEDDDRTLKEAFMTGVNIVPYLEQEDACLREAQHFVQRRLASQTAVGELTDSSTVDSDNLDKGEDDLLQDPSLAFLRGVDAETHARHCRELARLQTAYVTNANRENSARYLSASISTVASPQVRRKKWRPKSSSRAHEHLLKRSNCN